MMKRISLLEVAHAAVRQSVRVGDVVVDATLGNGHDTVFLAQAVGAAGRVYGFDIQPQAVQATRQRLQAQGLLDRVDLYLASHAGMGRYIPEIHHGGIMAVMFNLGYLPGADKNIITRADSTVVALTEACGLLAMGGVLTVTVYPGHPGGDEEAAGVEAWACGLDGKGYQVETVLSQLHQASAPRLFVVRKQA